MMKCSMLIFRGVALLGDLFQICDVAGLLSPCLNLVWTLVSTGAESCRNTQHDISEGMNLNQLDTCQCWKICHSATFFRQSVQCHWSLNREKTKHTPRFQVSLEAWISKKIPPPWGWNEEWKGRLFSANFFHWGRLFSPFFDNTYICLLWGSSCFNSPKYSQLKKQHDNIKKTTHPRSLTVHPWKMMLGRWSGFLLGWSFPGMGPFVTFQGRHVKLPGR